LEQHPQIDVPEWILERATAINAAGWMVGQGTFQGQPRVFLLQPVPEELLDAPGLSPATLSRLKQGWQEELTQWQQRDLSGKRYVYFWVDGVYLETRLETARHCILVIIGADLTG
jgi:hypothetical protein